MKIRFTSVMTEQVGSSLKGTVANYEARDSDGAGNIGIDSGGIAPTEIFQPTYDSIGVVQALTQSQIYNDFYPPDVITVVTGYEFDPITEEITPITEDESVGEAWKADLQESLDTQIEIAQVAAGLIVTETIDEIADQTPIDI